MTTEASCAAAPATCTLSEYESKQLLARHGVPMPNDRLVATPVDAAAAAAEIGGPVVVKLCGAGIAHKTERGLVRLGLSGATAVADAAAELLAAATDEDGEVALLVAPMVRGSRELIAGLNRDPQFGMTVMVGIGGIFAEAIGDVSIRLVPIERADAEEMIGDLATQRLLGPFRGEPPVDRDVLIDILLGLSRVGVDEPGLVSVDINPLIVVDGVPTAVDALVEVTAEERTA